MNTAVSICIVNVFKTQMMTLTMRRNTLMLSVISADVLLSARAVAGRARGR